MRTVSSTLLIASSFLAAGCAAEGEEIGTEAQALVLTGVNSSPNANGQVGTLPSEGPIDFTSGNAFFRSIGTNGRTCGTCHIQSAGWTITPATVLATKNANPNDPLFHPFDGSDCPIPTNTNPTQNSKQLLSRGNIRVDLPIPSTADFALNGFADPYFCASKPSASRIAMYRRPLPSTNLGFLATVMWDGRESIAPTLRGDLLRQANGATRGHANAVLDITDAESAAIVDFEMALFTTQSQLKVGAETVSLTAAGAKGGPVELAATTMPAFFVGINDTFAPDFNREAMTLFRSWEPSAPQTGLTSLMKSVGRGERLFNTRVFNITSVGGLNGPGDAIVGAVPGTCTTCHNSPNVGNHSSPLPIDIGIVEAAASSPAGQTLNISQLPIYTFRNKTTNQMRTVTDPGRAMITGKWKDIGKMKGPILRGLSSREPLFHNGSASIAQAVNFYNVRFNIGLTSAEKTDMINFLKAL